MLLYILPIHEILRTQNHLRVGFRSTGGYGWSWDHISGCLGRLRHTKKATESTGDAFKEAVSSVQLVQTAHENMREIYTFELVISKPLQTNAPSIKIEVTPPILPPPLGWGLQIVRAWKRLDTPEETLNQWRLGFTSRTRRLLTNSCIGFLCHWVTIAWDS